MQHLDCSSGAAAAVSRRDKFLLASVAMMGASAIALTPVSHHAVEIQQVQTRAYHLTAKMEATGSPLAVYGALVNNTVTNLTLLGSALAANPAPLLSQVLENQMGYAQDLAAAFAAIPSSLQTWWNGANGQARMAQVMASLQAGDFDEAFRWFNHSMLYAFQGVFGPLIAPGLILSGTPRGSTEYLAGIPEQMAQNFAKVVANVFTSSVLVNTIFQGAVAVFGGVTFELARVIEGITKSLASGDVRGQSTPS